jgi:hypothetical protein
MIPLPDIDLTSLVRDPQSRLRLSTTLSYARRPMDALN